MKRPLALIFIQVLLSAAQSSTEDAPPVPALKHVLLRGADLRYVEQGQGTAVIFVHGGSSDHRIWEHQRTVVSERYRFIALDQRYFGSAPWPDNGAEFSLATHVSDLAEFVRAKQLAPVYLVGQSYGAVVVLSAAIQHPELVRGLFVNEPPLLSVLTDPADLEIVREGAGEFSRISAMAKAGDTVSAARSFYDWVNGEQGAFDTLPAEARAVRLENARTLSWQFSPLTRASITCAQLRQLAVPVTITKGERTRAYFRPVAESVHRCIRGSSLVTIPGAQHGAPSQAPVLFNQALLAFLANH